MRLLALLLLLLRGAARAGECSWCPRCSPAGSAGEAGDYCEYVQSELDEHFYKLHSGTRVSSFMVSYAPGKYLSVQCSSALSLGGALPALPSAARVPLVRLHWCAPPREGGYARALVRLNVTSVDALQLELVPAAPPLRADHLAALGALSSLVLSGALLAEPPELPAALLAPLDTTLRSLRLSHVRAPPDLHLPRALESLQLSGAGLGALRWETPALRALSLTDPQQRAPPPLAATPALRDLRIYAPLDALPPLGRIENFTINGVINVTLVGSCMSLVRLRVQWPRSGALPLRADWLAGCDALSALTLQQLPRGVELPSDLLRPVAALQELTLSRCALAALPPRLLAYTPRLRRLDLSHNALQTLDSDVFAALPALLELDLSYNALGVADPNLTPALMPLERLQTLDLAHNPLGELCNSSRLLETSEMSQLLPPLSALQVLRLSATRAGRICVDWRRDLRRLRRLELRGNEISELKYSDLQWAPREGEAGGEATMLDLSGNPLQTLLLTRADYEQAGAASALRTQLTVELGPRPTLVCDCRAVWTARALRDGLLNVSFPHVPRCAEPLALTGIELRRVELSALVCPVPQGCPRGCVCMWRAADDTTVLQCSARGLTALPLLLRDAPAGSTHGYALNMSDNELTALPPRLPPQLRELDVSGNNLSALDAAVLRLLLGAERAGSLRAARNPLVCDCAARATLLVLRANSDKVADYAQMRCADGRVVRELEPGALCEEPGLNTTVLIALCGAALAIALGACGACAGRVGAPGPLAHRLKVLLLLRGDAAHGTKEEEKEEDDDENPRYKYDVFLSFSHRDAAVAEVLAAELEGGEQPLRLCLHHRDWRAGDWIPAQIARSVHSSRRTLVLLSEHFARSRWARVELREAAARALKARSSAASAARLVVVVLGATPPRLDAELQHYVARHTYLRWGEPAFWPRLRAALPAPRAALPAPATPIVALGAPRFTPEPKRKLEAPPARALPPAADTSPCA